MTRDEALIWRHGIGVEDLAIHVRPPIEVDHRHKRTGQYQHGHDSPHRFPDYFEDVSDQLRGYEGILVLGHGKGKGSYGELLIKFLEKKHPDLFMKVVDLVNVNMSAESEAEMKGSARSWFEKNYRTLSSWHDRPIDKRFR